MKRFIIIALTLSFSFFVFSCSEEDDAVTDTDPLIATWESDCMIDPDQTTESYKERLVASSLTAGTFSRDVYPDTTCATLMMTVDLTASSIVGSEITIDSGETVTEFDLIFTAASFTPKSATAVSDFNSTSMCGYTDWVLDVAKDVSAKLGLTQACGGPTLDEAIYTIYYLSNANTNLQLGDTNNSANDGSTAALRESVLSAIIMTKK